MFTELNDKIPEKILKAKRVVANDTLKEMRLIKVMRELDQECTVVYKATQIKEFKRLNKIHNRLREYKVLMDAMSLPTAKVLLEGLALEYYRLIRPELIKIDEGGN